MKTTRNNPGQQKKQAKSKKGRPENKDDLDSRKAKVADKDRTAKVDKNEKIKTKNPGHQPEKKGGTDTGNKTPKKPAKNAPKKAGKKTTTKK